MLAPKLKEKSAHTSGQGQKETKAYHHSNIIPRDSLRAKLIPLVHGGKEPDTKKGDTWKREFQDHEFRNGCNYGLRLGQLTDNAYLTVIDYDSDDYNQFANFLHEYDLFSKAFIVKSGGNHNGYHFYYLTDKPIKPFKFDFKGIEIEIRSSGQYVVIPPSKVKQSYKIKLNDTAFKLASPDSFFQLLSQKLSFVNSDIFRSLGNHQIDSEMNQKESKTKDNKPNNSEQDSKIYMSCSNSISYSLDSYLLDVLEIGYRNSKRINYYSLTRDKNVWKEIVNYLSLKLYGEKQKIENGKPFKCVIHKEKNPSATIFKTKSGQIIYKEHHQHEKGFETLNLFELVHYARTGKLKFITTKADRSKHFKELAELIKELGITSELGKAFYQKAKKFLHEIKNHFNENQTPDIFQNALTVLKKYIVPKAFEAWNLGHRTFLATVRSVQEITGLNIYKSNKGISVLIGLGIISREDDYFTKQGKSSYFSLNLDIDINQIDEMLSRLIKAGIIYLSNFSQRNPAMWQVFGKEKMQVIFTRKPDKKQGSDDYVSQSTNKESLSNGGAGNQRKRGNSDNGDTERNDNADNKELSERPSNTGGTNDKTIEDEHRKSLRPGGIQNESEVLENGHRKEQPGNHKSPPD